MSGSEAARGRYRRLSLWTYFVLYAAFLFFPLLLLAVFSFNDSAALALPWKGFTLRWYEKILETPELLASVQVSVIVAFASSLLAVALGTAIAIAVMRYRFPGRSALSMVAITPLVIPYLALAVALLVTFVAAGVKLSILTVVVGHTTVAIPYAVIIVASRLAGFDPSLEEAALDLGASRLRVLRRVYLPLDAPAVAGAFVSAFILSFDEFYLAFFLSGSDQTLPVYFFSGLRRPQLLPPTIALSTIIMIVTIAVVAVAELYRLRSLSHAEAPTPSRGAA
ncbi:MAG: ABC transporter permease [Actinomycetota bacterium]